MLGAQAKTRWAIVGAGAKSLQTQDVFHTISKETITVSDITTIITNMRTAINNTNVVLNLAISPGMILVPSHLIIQKEKIPGYNNVLTLATDDMRFGENSGVNYKPSFLLPQKRATKDSEDLSSENTKPKLKIASDKDSNSSFYIKPKLSKTSIASEILGVTMMISGFLISMYVF